jgi:hypothetical protein
LDVITVDVRVLRRGQEIERVTARPVRTLVAKGYDRVFAGVAYMGAMFPLHTGNSIDLAGPSFTKDACTGFVERYQPIPYAWGPAGTPEGAPSKPADAGPYRVWTRAEITILLESYFRMLQSELHRVPYSKADENRLVQKLTSRSRGSIEFKFCNVSAVLEELEQPFIRGYFPRRHTQQELHEAVVDFLGISRAKRDVDGGHHKSEAPLAAPARNSASHVLDYTYLPDSEMHYVIQCSCGHTAFAGGWEDARSLMSMHRNPAHQHPMTPPEHPRTGASVQAENGLWSILRTLWDHSTGGADVAAAPTSRVSEIKGPPAAGLMEAVDWMRERIRLGDSQSMLFLVGGPGAGKSHATTEIVQGLAEVSPNDDGLAHRSYRFRGPSAVLRVINDATIPDESDGRAKALSRDVESSIRDRENLVVCVNRGVLVEEAAATGDDVVDTPGSEVMRWLSALDGSTMPSACIASGSEHDFIRTARLYPSSAYLDPGDESAGIDLVAVYLDVCSLFEARPALALSPTEDGWEATGDAYEIAPLVERDAMPLLSMPAGALAADLLELLSAASTTNGVESNPVLANIQSLRSDRVRAALLTMLRCSEIASSQAFTYRELWGAMSRAIVGVAPLLGTLSDLQRSLDVPVDTDPKKRWAQMRGWSELRWTEALFNSQPTRAIKSTRDPVARLTYKADPARDALPGFLDPDRWDSGWATPVTDAFTSPEQAMPLAQMLEGVDADHPFREIVTDFDLALDRAYQEYTSPDLGLPDRQRQDAAAWYGAYLTRLYAGALGITAFRPTMAMWTSAWAFAPGLRPELGQCLLALVRPPLDPSHAGSASYLPLLESKAAPIVGNITEPRLAIKTDQIELRTKRDAVGGLRLELYESGQKITSVELDFTLTREALACTANRLGMTELSQSVSPRLERFRAARLLSANLRESAQYMVVQRDLPFPISVQGGA